MRIRKQAPNVNQIIRQWYNTRGYRCIRVPKISMTARIRDDESKDYVHKIVHVSARTEVGSGLGEWRVKRQAKKLERMLREHGHDIEVVLEYVRV